MKSIISNNLSLNIKGSHHCKGCKDLDMRKLEPVVKNSFSSNSKVKQYDPLRALKSCYFWFIPYMYIIQPNYWRCPRINVKEYSPISTSTCRVPYFGIWDSGLSWSGKNMNSCFWIWGQNFCILNLVTLTHLTQRGRFNLSRQMPLLCEKRTFFFRYQDSGVILYLVDIEFSR